MSEHSCVIGTGPTAVMAAHILQAEGARVTIIDVGLDLDQRSKALVDQYRRDGDQDRLLVKIHALRSRHEKLSRVQPGKALFGSNHPYKMLPETEITATNAVVRSSLAKGGLTTVWGATVGTVVPKDIQGWPFGFDVLEPHYRRLREVMDVISPAGEIRSLFPMEIGDEPNFPMGRQGGTLLDQLKSHNQELVRDGIHVGRAKLAVGAMYSRDGRGCTPCGLCMHGCPNNAIFSAAFVLDALRKRPGVQYESGLLVERFEEFEDRVRLEVKDVTSGARSAREFDRIFIACGVFNSTALVARSLGITDHEFRVLDSQKYIFPLLLGKRTKGAIKARDNTLAQIYLLVDNPEVCDNIVQVQYYGYNDLVLEPIRARLGLGGARLVSEMGAMMLERMIISFVYLHSNVSGYLGFRVNPDPSGPLGSIVGYSNPKSEVVIKALLKLLARHRKAHGGLPVQQGLQATLPGDSQHNGASLPMAKSPGRYETDLLGRPHNHKRVHVVDASVLPTVPGTPIVYTAMANASRIATGAMRGAEAVGA